MLILGLDLETSGLDVEKDGVVEIGAVIYDTELQVPVYTYSGFIKDTNAVRWGATR